MDYENGIWVFGYGSLIWNPGFDYAEKKLATLGGFHRAFCMWSVHYRGTEATPGLVLGLDATKGARCEGVAYYIEADTAPKVHAYLQERELVSYAYLEQWHPLRLEDGREVEGLCYIVDPAHRQYANGLDLPAQAAVIAAAEGSAGPNSAYLLNTAEHLQELGIKDSDMQALSAMLKAEMSAG